MKINIVPDLENLLPPLSGEELKQLEANCKADPKHERMPPVVLWSNHNNTIVDGHNQYKTRTRLRLKVKFAEMEFDSRDEAMTFALNVQFGRRNLDASQRAMAYAKVARKPVGKPDSNVANLQHLDGLAAKAKVSKRTMSDATKVVKKSPKRVVKAVEQGTVKVSDAAAVADKPKPEQSAALNKVESGKAPNLRAVFNPPPPNDNSLEAVQADLKELEKRCRDVARYARTILDCEGNEIRRPFCNCYSVLTIIQPLQHVARSVANDMPVGGTPRKPVLFHEQKAKG